MKRLAGLALIGALLLTGCTATPGQTDGPPAVAQASTFEDISTLDDAIAHVRTISADTPDLSGEISGTAQTLGELVVEAELPWDVNNEVGQDLISLNSAVLNDPTSAGTMIGELNRIADSIEDAR